MREGKISKGGQNPPNTSDKRPLPPKRSSKMSCKCTGNMADCLQDQIDDFVAELAEVVDQVNKLSEAFNQSQRENGAEDYGL